MPRTITVITRPMEAISLLRKSLLAHRTRRDGVAGGNGVFAYGTNFGSFNATNYWVDVVFSDGPVTRPN
jgi:hypothetical protein